MTAPTVLVTGAAGTLGPAAVARLLRRGSVVALLRPRGELDPRIRALRTMVRAEDHEAPLDLLEVVSGDLARPGAGLTPGDRRRLARGVTHVLHLAADTRFSRPWAEARTANLDTTVELLRLAEDFRHLQRFGFTSTLYVAGTRTGEIQEVDLLDTAFVNTYERAKFEAERALRARMGDLPIVVFRVATLLGSARSGEVRKTTAIHQALRLHHRGLIPMIPGDPDQPLEMLDAEHAAEALTRLLLERSQEGRTYHLTAAPGETLSLRELVEETHRAFEKLDPTWKAREIEPPPIVSARTYGLFERTVAESGDTAMSAVIRSLGAFLPQLLHPKRFARTNTENALPDWRPPSVREYLPRVLSYCLRSRWGRSPDNAALVASQP